MLVAAAPVTLVAAVGFGGAWLRGLARRPGCAGPRRWSLPMTAVYLAGRALHATHLDARSRSLPSVTGAPPTMWPPPGR